MLGHVETDPPGLEQVVEGTGGDHAADEVVVKLEQEVGAWQTRETTAWERPLGVTLCDKLLTEQALIDPALVFSHGPGQGKLHGAECLLAGVEIGVGRQGCGEGVGEWDGRHKCMPADNGFGEFSETVDVGVLICGE